MRIRGRASEEGGRNGKGGTNDVVGGDGCDAGNGRTTGAEEAGAGGRRRLRNPLGRAMIGTCVAAVNGVIAFAASASVLTVLHPALLPLLALIAVPRSWGALRVAQRR